MRRFSFGFVVLLLLVVAGVAVPSVLGAIGDARRGRDALASAEEALRAQDADTARARLGDAAAAFTSAHDRLTAPYAEPASWIPGLRRQFLAGRALARAGELASRAGIAATEALEARPGGGFKLSNGAVDLASLDIAAGALRDGLPLAERAAAAVRDAPEGWLLPSLSKVRGDGERDIVRARDAMRRGVAGLEAAPRLLGADARKRYLVAAGNLSELRGTGGFFNFFAVVETSGGRIRHLADTGRPTSEFPPPETVRLDLPDWFTRAYGRYGATRIWPNVNMATDFPTVGSLVVQAVPEPPGPVDGVIQIDADGIGALLELTGPVSVPGWRDPITPANVAEVTQHDVYKLFPRESIEREAFVAALIGAVFERVLGSDITIGESSLETLGEAVAGGHIQAYVSEDDLQASLSAAGLARGVERAYDATDVFSLVNENASGNKIDWFLRRSVTLRATPDPEANTVDMDLAAVLRNESPADGLPSYIIGGPHVEPGHNRTIAVVLRPPFDELGGLAVDGVPQAVSRDQEAALRSYHGQFTIAPGAEVKLDASFTAPDALSGSGRHRTYRLHVLRQPVAFADAYSVTVEVPKGWRARGPTTFEGPLTSDLVLEVELDHTLPAWLFEAAIQRPYRLAERLIRDLF